MSVSRRGRLRALRPVQLPPPAALFPRRACGWPVTRASRQCGTSLSAWQLPGLSETFRGRRSISDRSSQCASLNGAGLGRPVWSEGWIPVRGFRPSFGGYLQMSGRFSGLLAGTRSSSHTCGGCHTAGPPPFPRSTACSQCAPNPGRARLLASVLGGTARAHCNYSGSRTSALREVSGCHGIERKHRMTDSTFGSTALLIGRHRAGQRPGPATGPRWPRTRPGARSARAAAGSVTRSTSVPPRLASRSSRLRRMCAAWLSSCGARGRTPQPGG